MVSIFVSVKILFPQSKTQKLTIPYLSFITKNLPLFIYLLSLSKTAADYFSMVNGKSVNCKLKLYLTLVETRREADFSPHFLFGKGFLTFSDYFMKRSYRRISSYFLSGASFHFLLFQMNKYLYNQSTSSFNHPVGKKYIREKSKSTIINRSFFLKNTSGAHIIRSIPLRNYTLRMSG